jgi:hypothetical protein
MWYCSEAGNGESGTGNGNFRGLPVFALTIASLHMRLGRIAWTAIHSVELLARIASAPVPRSPVPAHR